MFFFSFMVQQFLKKIALSNIKMVKIFDPTDIYCDKKNGKCQSIRDGRLMYSYTDHISDFASGLVGKKLNEFVKNN